MKLDKIFLKWARIAKKTIKKKTDGGSRETYCVLFMSEEISKVMETIKIPKTQAGSCVRELEVIR